MLNPDGCMLLGHSNSVVCIRHPDSNRSTFFTSGLCVGVCVCVCVIESLGSLLAGIYSVLIKVTITSGATLREMKMSP